MGTRSLRPGMKGIVFVAWCAIALPLSVQAHDLGEAAASMVPGEWRELATLNMPATMDATNGGVPEYGDSAVWDPLTQRVFAHGQGHENGTGDFKVVSYDAESNRWETLPTPPWYSSYPHLISHGYDHNALNPDTGTYYLRPFQSSRIYAYNTREQSWSEIAPILNWSMSDNCCGGLVHFPEMNSLVIAASGVVGSYSYDSRSWSLISNNVPMGGYHNFAEYSPGANAVLLGGGPDGGGNPRQIHRLNADGSIDPLNDAPIALGTTAAVVTHDPVSGNFLVLGSGGILRNYDMESDTWSIESDSAPFPVFDTLAVPIQDHGVVMFFYWDTGSSGRVYLYKASPFTPPPPVVAPAPPEDLGAE